MPRGVPNKKEAAEPVPNPLGGPAAGELIAIRVNHPNHITCGKTCKLVSPGGTAWVDPKHAHLGERIEGEAPEPPTLDEVNAAEQIPPEFREE